MKSEKLSIIQPEMRVRCGVTSGSVASDGCYALRNVFNLFACPLGQCMLEKDLMSCLSTSGEPNWWKDFPRISDQEAACGYTRSNTKGMSESDRNDMLKKMGCTYQ